MQYWRAKGCKMVEEAPAEISTVQGVPSGVDILAVDGSADLRRACQKFIGTWNGGKTEQGPVSPTSRRETLQQCRTL